MVGNYSAVLNLNWFLCNELPVLPNHTIQDSLTKFTNCGICVQSTMNLSLL